MLSEQEIIRREKLKKLREYGINPYPPELFKISYTTDQIISNFEENKEISIAGRLMSRRIQGKASFAEIQDCILIEMKFALVKTNRCIMKFIKNF